YGRQCLYHNRAGEDENPHHPHRYQHPALHVRPHSRGTAQEGAAGSQPQRELHECRGCSMARGLRKSIARSTHTGADTLRLSALPRQLPLLSKRGSLQRGRAR
ncbi:unnamed protein product, partial [Ascophyllum nodosum]